MISSAKSEGDLAFPIAIDPAHLFVFLPGDSLGG